MIKVQLHQKTLIKLSSYDGDVTFSPRGWLHTNNFSCVSQFTISMNLVNMFKFQHVLKTANRSSYFKNHPQVLRDFVFFEQEANEKTASFYAKNLLEFNKVEKEITKHLKRKHDIDAYNHLDVKYF